MRCRETLRAPRSCVPTIRATAQHAAVRCDADERQRLEQLCRYVTRPALANERVQINSAGQVVLKLKTAWRDGTTHIVMSPLEFMQRLAALVPRPRLHLIRFHGVLAPNAKLRALVVPQAPEEATGKSELTATEPGCAHGRPARISWVRLLKRVFQIDLEHCPNCGGEIKIIAVIVEAPGTRADPQAPGAAGSGTAQGAGARRFSAGGVTAARSPGLRAGAAPDAGRAR